MTARPRRLRLRRRLLWLSAPVVAVALLVSLKMLSVVIAGHSAVSNFESKDADGLHDNASTLAFANVIEPAKAPFAAGAAAVLDGRLDEADAKFLESLSLTPRQQSCPVRINLQLTRERQGDIDAWEGRPDEARDRYSSALTVVNEAPAGCFAGNDDPDEDRRAVRNDAAARLAAKIAGLDVPPAAPPPPPPPAAAAPPPPPPPAAPDAADPDAPLPTLLLEPDAGDPADKLRQILQDAAG
ncbi:hypothetical protein CQY20_09300 [Mycolicibacterium agri]|uniref:Uncharacterized protein n=1 Tax=Mycolicibacterium agri TaxID=36811 RepID=A0A2A7N7C8_MYCAG|nr:hypothetical protein [Mycolicibacterium agri]PEG39739.1 hypothetical protein CQY20_09300 [Mycolicibacterium agri]GFG52552.1 hypothetical protein MAGR_39930 [Mycolicibacterium agri]